MNLKRISKKLSLAICVNVAVLYVSVHSATTNIPVDANIVVEGTIPDSEVFNGPVRLTVRALTIKPGEELPCHYHPGVCSSNAARTIAVEMVALFLLCKRR